MPNTPSITPQSTATQPHQSFVKKWGSLFILSLALAIIIMDSTILNVSLKPIINDLGTTRQGIQWIITLYSLVLAALTITGGRLGDLFGRKRMFMVGAILFAIGSLVAAISQNVIQMLIGESLIEGIGAALMMPATASLLISNFQGKDRALAFGVWGGIAGASSAIGPIVGGWLTTNFSWRYGFLINVGVVAVLLLGSVLIKEAKDRVLKATLDFVGVFLSSIAMLFIIFGVIESSDYGWWVSKKDLVVGDWIIYASHVSFVPLVIAIGLVLLGLFMLWEWRLEKLGKTPLVSLSLFSNRTFTAGVFTTAILSLGQVGLFFVLPYFWQYVKGYDAYHSGLSGLPLSIAILIVAPLSSRLTNYLSPKTIIQIGLLINVVAVIWMRASLGVDATVWTLAPSLTLYGVGIGLMMAQISNLTLSSVAMSQAGEAAGVNNTMRQVGSSFGSAIIGAVFIGAIITNVTAGVTNSTTIPTSVKTSIIQAQNNQRPSETALNPTKDQRAITQEVTSLSNSAIVTAGKEALWYTALFSLLGLICSLSLPGAKKEPAPRVEPLESQLETV
jgi:EmrB/QacA subfamily drug resistance transporter